MTTDGNAEWGIHPEPPRARFECELCGDEYVEHAAELPPHHCPACSGLEEGIAGELAGDD